MWVLLVLALMMGLVFGLPLVSITSLSINLSSQINVYYCIANLASTISFVKDLILMRFSLFRCSIFFAIAMTILKCAPIALERIKCLILNSFVGLYGVVYKPLFLEDRNVDWSCPLKCASCYTNVQGAQHALFYDVRVCNPFILGLVVVSYNNSLGLSTWSPKQMWKS